MQTWTKSRAIAAQRIDLAACPLCDGARCEPVFTRNNLVTRFDIDRRLTYSDYRLCQDCGGVFAARRETAESAQAYYDLFPDIEERGYAKKVIPAAARKGKIAVAEELCATFAARQMLRPGMAVLHVRCDAGSLLAAIGAAAPGSTLHGLDYFPTNLEAARDAGFEHMALLSPAKLEIPFQEKYDLIVCNHIFTHSLTPAEDLQVLKNALKDQGQIFFYNENDHDAIFDANSDFFSRIDMISYHKQLLDLESFTRFLSAAGFSSEFIGRRKFTFAVLARVDAHAIVTPPPSAEITQRRARIKSWAAIAERNRYLLPFAKWARQHKALKWLAQKASDATAGQRPKKKKPAKNKAAIASDSSAPRSVADH